MNKNLHIIDPATAGVQIDLRMIEVTAGIAIQVASAIASPAWLEKRGHEMPRCFQPSAMVTMNDIYEYLYANDLVFNKHEDDETLYKVTKTKGSYGDKVFTQKDLEKAREAEEERLAQAEEDALEAEETKRELENTPAEEKTDTSDDDAKAEEDRLAKEKEDKEAEDKKAEEDRLAKEKDDKEAADKLAEEESKEGEEEAPKYAPLSEDDIKEYPDLSEGFKVGDEVEVIGEEGKESFVIGEDSKFVAKPTEEAPAEKEDEKK